MRRSVTHQNDDPIVSLPLKARQRRVERLVLLVHRLIPLDDLHGLSGVQAGKAIERIVQQANPVDEVIDTTGAGDAYTAGFLYGWVNDKPLAECARLGTFCGGRVIQQIGARIEPGLLDDYS